MRSVKVVTTPPGATVYWDGAAVGKTPATLHKVAVSGLSSIEHVECRKFHEDSPLEIKLWPVRPILAMVPP